MSMTHTSRKGIQCVSVTLAELLQLSNGAREFSLSARRIMNSQSGPHLSRLLGRGMEFAESRRYQTGDDIRNIDWKVTARTGKAHTKLFTVEKERQILLLADMRSSMFFATKGVFKSVQGSLLMGYIGWNAIQTGNRLGGTIIDDVQHFEFRPTMGKRGILPYLERLSKCSIPSPGHRPPPNSSILEKAIDNIQRVSSPGSLIFVISDFRHLTSQAHDTLLRMSKQCDLCLCFIFDPLEAVLPKNGYYPITNGQKELQLNTFNKNYLEQYQRQFEERRNKVKSLGNCHRILYIECSTEEDCLSVLKHHFH